MEKNKSTIKQSAISLDGHIELKCKCLPKSDTKMWKTAKAWVITSLASQQIRSTKLPSSAHFDKI